MRVLVTGDRNGFDYDRMWDFLDALLKDAPAGEEFVLIQGGARGVDTMARDWALSRRVKYEEFPALWGTYGRRAGPIRNTQMLKEGRPDLVVAFHHNLEGSKGTKHMVGIAEKAGVKVYLVKR